jgi:allantoicase
LNNLRTKIDASRDIQWLNTLSSDEAAIELLKCCGSKEWTRRMSAERPFQDLVEMLSKAVNIWRSLSPEDWLESFRGHPKIGENKTSSADDGIETQKWSDEEQAGVHDAKPETISSLAELNRRYETKFGYIFIVCATGKSSEEMLADLRERLENDPAKELPIAAAEQAKITELRLNKLLAVSR